MSKLSKTILARYKNARHYLSSLQETFKNGYPAKKMIVIGVTGTDGKTTTAHLIHHLGPLAYLALAGIDELINLAGGLVAALRQPAHFFRHHGKAGEIASPSASSGSQ